LFVAILVIVLVAAIAFMLPATYGFIAILVQIATIAALIFPVYSWGRERLDDKRELVDTIRIWADHFRFMTDHFVGMPANEVTGENVKMVQELADKTADHLAESLARAGRIVDLTGPAYNQFILELRTFARKEEFTFPGNGHLFLHELESKLRPKAASVDEATNKEIRKFEIRHGVPERYRGSLETIIVLVFGVCLLVFVLLFLGRI